MIAGQPNIERILNEEQARLRAEQARRNGRAAVRAGVEFTAIGDDRYRLMLPAIGVAIEVDRLRRERNQLMGELSVRCELPGARTFDGSLFLGDFNLSSLRARSEMAKHLAQRANTSDVDWQGFIEELCQRVLKSERTGQPAVDLRTLPAPAADDALPVEGLRLLRRHPTFLFGDGGACKSYLGLYLAGRLAEREMRVALFDWELCGDDHRDRLERLFPDGMPRILYARCERPLVYEADRLRRIVRENGIEYSIFDSVAFACDGPPEAAEVAGRYFRAVRQIGGGSLHVAHVSKAENADQKPFGSAFWHNGARSTWYAQLVSSDGENLNLRLFNRKANLGRLQPPIGFTVSFSEERTTFKRTDVADTPELAAKLTVCQRMKHLLRRGPMTPEAIAEEIEQSPETVSRTVRRYKGKLFTVIEGGRIGLLERSLS